MVLSATIEAPVREETKIERDLNRKKELRDLEKWALELGIDRKELGRIQHIGSCPDQILTRINILWDWIISHQR